MTPQSESERVPPEILSNEDIPPTSETEFDNQTKDVSLSKEKSTSLDIKKFTLGSTTLGWCIFLMFLCVALSLWQPDNELVKSGFDAFRLIVMTILGYMFGSNAKS